MSAFQNVMQGVPAKIPNLNADFVDWLNDPTSGSQQGHNVPVSLPPAPSTSVSSLLSIVNLTVMVFSRLLPLLRSLLLSINSLLVLPLKHRSQSLFPSFRIQPQRLQVSFIMMYPLNGLSLQTHHNSFILSNPSCLILTTCNSIQCSQFLSSIIPHLIFVPLDMSVLFSGTPLPQYAAMYPPHAFPGQPSQAPPIRAGQPMGMQHPGMMMGHPGMYPPMHYMPHPMYSQQPNQ